MNLKERVYSVLVVSASENLNNALSDILSPSVYSPIRYVSSVSSARKILAERSFDLMIVNSPLPDDIGVKLSIDTADSRSSVVLFMTRNEIIDELNERVSPYGVFTLAKPISRTSVSNALRWMCSARELIRKDEIKTLSLEEKMDEIRIVNRAKWFLISDEGLSEEEAHRKLEKEAMNRCISKRELAEEIIGRHQKDL